MRPNTGCVTRHTGQPYSSKGLDKRLDKALTLKEDADKQNSADAQVTNSEVPENDNKAEKEEDKTLMPACKMTEQELQLQKEEEK